ncbi:MAG TPA: cob(I)yrinic acid a,c-diamide adenosyltransferase [Solirubrobacterales bacterium]|jgi:cob(I)alamin adenosyltransferase|nr:cob(I)yrinic acid a,c-diamide adenosyltransferase [Solirubrobacterales bacterium]
MSEVKIYTRKGDDGTTGLWYGGRVPKSHPRTSAYGDVDEAISTIGVARAAAKDSYPSMAEDLLEMQRCMFIGCAELATAPEAMDRLESGVTRIADEMVDDLERKIDAYKEKVDLPPKFIIPGGNELSAQLDVARTVVRRAERAVVSLKLAGELEDDAVIRYLNRSSDLLFVMARYADDPEPVIFEGRG